MYNNNVIHVRNQEDAERIIRRPYGYGHQHYGRPYGYGYGRPFGYGGYGFGGPFLGGVVGGLLGNALFGNPYDNYGYGYYGSPYGGYGNSYYPYY